MRDDRRIEQRRGFDRVLLGEVRADEPSTGGRQCPPPWQQMFDERRVRGEGRVDIAVAVAEPATHGSQAGQHVRIGECEHPVDDGLGAGNPLSENLLAGQK
ncbi:hypothetical protein AB0L63_04045 [Nocardia sp. NPDC051990]|uniref:hypothetical protein n=1 Tax=Nocardia sp. NPDC051990 TaxID=3155285 RepID=UPI0034235BF3